MKLTNISNGPRGIFDAEGQIITIPAGQTVDVKLTKEAAADINDEWFKAGAKAEKPAETGDAQTAAEVLALADGNFMSFKSAASKILGDATPSKKDEIIAALEDLATKP